VDDGVDAAFVDADRESEDLEQEARLTRTRRTTTQAHARQIRALLENV
jgi:hypothetical protein